MKKMLPGPYTFILPSLKIVPKIMLTKQKTVGIRVPDNPISVALVDGLGNPVVTTSAIIEDDDTPLANAYELEDRFGNMVDAIIDAGPIFPSPSSIVSLIEEPPVVLREGKGDVSMFQA